MARCANEPGGAVVLDLEPTDDSVPVTYKAVEFDVRKSEITGDEVIDYSDRPIEVQTRLYNGTRVSKAVVPPAAYLVPPQWTEVIERLELHGVEFSRLTRAEQLDVESYRFEDVTFAGGPFEGRLLPSYTAVPVRETREFIAGTVLVPLNQKRAKVAVHLLEPEAPDSLVAWGFCQRDLRAEGIYGDVRDGADRAAYAGGGPGAEARVRGEAAGG